MEGGGGTEKHHLLRGSQASPTRLSGSRSMKMKICEKDVTLLTAVAENDSREISVSY
jgi:hypothetical protein